MKTGGVESFGGHRHYHRPLEFYVAWLADIGFGVTGLTEPQVPTWKAEDELTDYDRWLSSIPTMLGIAAVRIS